jgi:ubiquinone/menaquinone biosynthesis C-methylase UbiE
MWISLSSRRRERGRRSERVRYESSARAFDRSDVPFDEQLTRVPAGARGAYRRYVAEVRALPSGARILEVGAGTGDYSWPILDRGVGSVFLDYSAPSLRSLEDRARLRGNVPLTVCGDAEALPFADGSFDAVVAMGVLSYVVHDQFTREAIRVVSEGGTIVLCDSVKGNPIYWLNRMSRVLRGSRTLWAARNIPPWTYFSSWGSGHGSCEAWAFGSLAFLEPILRRALPPSRLDRFFDRTDCVTAPSRFGFKVVMRFTKGRGACD